MQEYHHTILKNNFPEGSVGVLLQREIVTTWRTGCQSCAHKAVNGVPHRCVDTFVLPGLHWEHFLFLLSTSRFLFSHLEKICVWYKFPQTLSKYCVCFQLKSTLYPGFIQRRNCQTLFQGGCAMLCSHQP